MTHTPMLVRDAPPAQLPQLRQVHHLRRHELLELALRVRHLHQLLGLLLLLRWALLLLLLAMRGR